MPTSRGAHSNATMIEPDQHSSPIKTPKQLVIVVLLAFIVPIAIIGLLSQLFTSSSPDTTGDEQRILERIKPVGTIVIADASAPHGNLTGEQVYGQVCKTCHEAGLAGAPKMGDKAAWTPRIAEGESTLLQHAIGGFQGKSGVMPPKGGNTDLTDDEVHRAVVYLANQAGAGWKEPAPTATAATSATPVAANAGAAAGASNATPSAPATGAVATAAPIKPAGAPATASAAQATAPAAPATASSAGAGKAVYDSTCQVCHATGLAGSPKFGDKAAWAPRIATGIDTLHKAALNGLNAMPPRGGNSTLTDAQVIAAVDYMVSAAK